MGSYRRRNLEHLNEWLPREKLYSLPRSLQTQGSRALGRLAFADETTVVHQVVDGPVVRQVSDPSDRFWDVLTWRLADGR